MSGWWLTCARGCVCSVFTTLLNNNSDKFETYFSKSILNCHAVMEAVDADTGGRPSIRFDSCIFYFIGHFSPTAYCPINKSYFNTSSRRQVTKLPQQMHTLTHSLFVCVCSAVPSVSLNRQYIGVDFGCTNSCRVTMALNEYESQVLRRVYFNWNCDYIAAAQQHTRTWRQNVLAKRECELRKVLR